MYTEYPACRRFYFCAAKIALKPEQEIQPYVVDAWGENQELFLKILFYLMKLEKKEMKRLIQTVFRYFVDCNVKEGTAALKTKLEMDLVDLKTGKTVSSLAWWLPSINASSRNSVALANRLAKSFDMTPAQYRKTLSVLRSEMREQKSFENQTACVSSGTVEETRVHEIPLMCDIMRRILRRESGEKGSWMAELSDEERNELDVQWKRLPNYKNKKTALVVTGGDAILTERREGICAGDMEAALALYFSERNVGYWNNRFVVSKRNEYRHIDVKGDTIYEKAFHIENFGEPYRPEDKWSRYVSAKIHLLKVLDDQLFYHVDVIYIVGDCELHNRVNYAAGWHLKRKKDKFASNGLKFPQIVYWNLGKEALRHPVSVTENESGITMISGYSPEILEAVLRCEVSAYPQMMKALEGTC